MGLRRIAAGDQRRRRVLIEERLSVVSAEADPDQPRQPASELGLVTSNSYSDAACLQRQSPSVILLASRPFTLTVAALSALVLLVGLLAAYGQWRLWPRDQLPAPLSVLDLERPGNLADWICSLLLAAAAFQGVQIYRLRRHKTDDYRGRYRVWVWTPLILLAMAAGQATGFHRDLVQLAVALVSPKASVEYAQAWPFVAAATWVLVAVRLAFELRVNRWATAFLAMATVGYLTGLMTTQLTVQPISQILVVFSSSALLTIGHLGVFISVLIFGRHVYLDSQGLLPARSAKPRRVKPRVRKAATEKKKPPRKAEEVPVQETPSEETGEDSPGSEPQEVQDVARPVLQLGTGRDEHGNEDEDEDSASPSSGEKLSKTERRRLKKLRQQEQMRRAA
jgi:hypothetical protein